MQSAADQVLVAGVRLVLDQSPFHVFVLSLSMVEGGQSAKKRGASLITEKNLYVIGQEEKRQGYNAGIDK
mgnify:CR=1 FL=1